MRETTGITGKKLKLSGPLAQEKAWLNEKLFREPLYLLDRPYHVEDDRTDLEKKFPEFFRTKLRREGWEVPEAKSTVPIPGYNMPADADYRTYDPAKGG